LSQVFALMRSMYLILNTEVTNYMIQQFNRFTWLTKTNCSQCDKGKNRMHCQNWASGEIIFHFWHKRCYKSHKRLLLVITSNNILVSINDSDFVSIHLAEKAFNFGDCFISQSNSHYSGGGSAWLLLRLIFRFMENFFSSLNSVRVCSFLAQLYFLFSPHLLIFIYSHIL